MALIETRAPDRDTALVIRRLDHTVAVYVRAPITSAVVAELRHTLSDLVQDQGNLSVTLDLPDFATPDGGLVSLLVETADQLASRNGSFTARTSAGEWTRPAPGPSSYRPGGSCP
jgi:hypothetical protein